jgi:GDPmannose 4,6-dehydratase
VLATGETTLVRDFVSHAFAQTGVEVTWRGRGVEEQGICAKTGRVLVEVDPRYFRPTEVDLLIGDASKAKDRLGWQYETSWRALCEEMVAEDLVTVPKEDRRNAE